MITSGFLAGMLKAGQSPVFRNKSIVENKKKKKLNAGKEALR
jgi:hypothetical protein